MFQDAQTKGRKAATTFTGFCSFHDKTLFQDIEDREFTSTSLQIFLYTYRTLAWHYHKKFEQVNRTTLSKDLAIKHELPGAKNPTNTLQQLQLVEKIGLFENEKRLEKLNKYLVDESYAQISSYTWIIPYEVQIAVSAMLEIEHDIDGHILNDLESSKMLKSIYLNIFPGSGVSYCLWSWVAEDKIYDNYIKQFSKLSIEDRSNYLNNYLPRWTDAIVISPRLWDKWGADIQQAFIAHSNFEILYRQMEFEENKYEYEYMETPWDFFTDLGSAL